MIGVEQRWRWRDPMVPRGLFDPAGYTVVSIDYKPAREFVAVHHYIGTMPASKAQYGLVDPAGWLVGVAVFSVSASQSVIPKWTGLRPSAGVELGRFVLLDEVGYNGETWFLVRCFDAIRDNLVDVRAIVSFSDPAVWPSLGLYEPAGHRGIIYQGANGRYVGRANAKTLLLGAKTGRPISPRALSKLRTLDVGHEYARRQLEVEFGDGPDDNRAYLREVMSRAPRARHPGNHCYVWPIGRGPSRRAAQRDARCIAADFPPAMTYPTQPDAISVRRPA